MAIDNLLPTASQYRSWKGYFISHKSCSFSGPRLNRAFPYQFELLRRLKLFPASVCFHHLLCSTGQKPGLDIAVLCRELVDPFARTSSGKVTFTRTTLRLSVNCGSPITRLS
jgi:hypothetical protein